ncbi:MAG: hypothetical protein E7490_06685 [Ruminococcaceae bacterium]|nr:hypothetical protein [Oscillospiraceae bacterium]
MKLTDTYFSRYFFYKLLKHKVLLIVSLVANILALPLMAIITSSSVEGIYNILANITEEAPLSFESKEALANLAGSAESAFVICIFVFAVLTIISIAAPTLVMSYNNKRSDSDMYLSLPISTKGRFLADALAGFFIAVLPLAINFLGGFIFIQKAAGVLSEHFELFDSLGVTDLTRLCVCNAYDMFFLAATTGIITVTAVYFTSLFFTCCTGRRAESVIYSIATPLVALLTINNLVTLILNTTRGITSWPELENIPAHMPVFGTLLAGMGRFTKARTVTSEMVPEVLAFPVTVIISAIIICFLLLFAAYICTKKRKAENTGKPFAIEFIYKVIMTLLVVCFVGMLVVSFRKNQSGLAVTILILFAVYMALQLFHYKSIKKIPMHLLHLVLTSAIAFGGFTLIGLSEGFGYGRYIPDTKQVESIEVCEGYTGFRNDINTLIYTDENDIKKISELHKMCVDNKAETGYWFQITYNMKDGSEITRRYIYNPNINTNVGSEIKKVLLSLPATVNQILLNEHSDQLSGTFMLKEGFLTKELSENGVKKLAEAIKLDIENGSFTTGKTIGYANSYWNNDDGGVGMFEIAITENCENMIAVLKNKENYHSYQANQFYNTREESERPDAIFIAMSYIGEEEHLRYLRFHIRNKDLDNEKVKALTDLFEVHEPDKEKNVSYMIEFNDSGVLMFITAENAEKAEKLIKEIEADREKNNDKVDFAGFYTR